MADKVTTPVVVISTGTTAALAITAFDAAVTAAEAVSGFVPGSIEVLGFSTFTDQATFTYSISFTYNKMV